MRKRNLSLYTYAYLLVGLATCWIIGCSAEAPYELRPIRPTAALEEYEKSRSSGPSPSQYELGWLYLQEGRTRAAREVFARLVERLPEDPDAHFYLGVAQAKEHLKTEAIASFKRALQLAPGLADAHWALALLYNERGDGFDEALQAAERGLALAPGNAYGHFVEGFILCSRGENDRAETALKQSIDLDPSSAHAHYYLALIYLRRQNDTKAIAAMEQTIEADPSYTEAYYSLGTLYARTGRVDEGQQMIELFQRLSSSDMDEDHYRRLLYRGSRPLAEAERAAGHFNLGLVYLRREQWDGALAQFGAAVTADSTYAEAQHNLGVVFSLKGQHEEALNHFNKAVALKPDYGLAHKNRGNSYLVRGEYALAEAAFRSALVTDDTLAEALHGLGTALIQQGQIEAGRSARQRAVEIAGKGIQ